MRSLLSKMAGIHHENSKSHSFKRGFVSDLKSTEQKSILINYGLTPLASLNGVIFLEHAILVRTFDKG